MEPVIAPFTPDKLEETQTFLRIALRDNEFIMDFATRDADLSDIAARYQQAGGEFWLLLSGTDQVVIGTLGLQRVNDDTLELRRFVVHEPMRNHGFGEKMLLTALDYAVRVRCNRIRLMLPAQQDAAMHLLKKHRFHIIKRFSDDPLSNCFMEHRIQQTPPAAT